MPSEDQGQGVDQQESGTQQNGGFDVASKCAACGTLIGAVDEETHRKIMASHVLEQHREEAHPDLIEECEEVLS